MNLSEVNSNINPILPVRLMQGEVRELFQGYALSGEKAGI